MTAVELDGGWVRGTVEAGVARFRGIPYAASPTGALRFAPPEPAGPWAGVRDATRPGPAVPQGRSVLEPILGPDPAPQSEDGCLTLTVDAPAGATGLPVLVWLHGGAFRTGRSGGARQSGARLAGRGDIVVVSLNYRLGPLGYLHPGGDRAGNAGLLDQAAALRWVVRNVAAFGGDPGRITLGGHSAGALSAVALTGSPLSEGVVRRLVLLSPPFGDVTTPERAAAEGRDLLEVLGIDAVGIDAVGIDAADIVAAPEALQVLRRLPAEALVEAAGELARRSATGPSSQLVVGGAGLPAGPPALEDRLPADLDVLVGTTLHEARAFRLAAPGIPVEHADAMTETLFTGPVTRFCARRAALGRPAFRYRFDWQPRDGFGACHGIDIPFLFGDDGAWSGAPALAGVPDAEHATLRDAFGDAVTGFVRTGVPTPPGPVAWEPATADNPDGARFAAVREPVTTVEGAGR